MVGESRIEVGTKTSVEGYSTVAFAFVRIATSDPPDVNDGMLNNADHS